MRHFQKVYKTVSFDNSEGFLD